MEEEGERKKGSLTKERLEQGWRVPQEARAFLMLHHPRLGRASPMRELPSAVSKKILMEFLSQPPTWGWDMSRSSNNMQPRPSPFSSTLPPTDHVYTARRWVRVCFQLLQRSTTLAADRSTPPPIL